MTFDEATTAHAVDYLTNLCHGAAEGAGWWIDYKTGANYLDEVRTGTRFGKALAAEKHALIHSEISESLEGVRKGKMDEHCPEFTSEEVEMADAVIRIMDYAGARQLRLGAALVAKMAYNAVREDHKIENRALEGGKAF